MNNYYYKAMSTNRLKQELEILKKSIEVPRALGCTQWEHATQRDIDQISEILQNRSE